MYVDNPKLVIEVSIWKSKEEIETTNINFIYQDDKIEVAIKKLLEHFNFTDIYVWTDDESVEFNTSIHLNNINPFFFDKTQDTKQLKITEKKGIFSYQKINIVERKVFENDKKLLSIFFKYSRPSTSINENKLNELYEQSAQNEIVSTVITNYVLSGKIELEYTLKYYYRKIDSSSFDVTGWIYDNYNKHFTVKSNNDYTTIVNDLNKIQYEQSTLIFIKYLIYFKSYYIIEINQNGDINVKLVLGNKIKYSIKSVLQLRKQIGEFIKTLFNQEILLNDKVLKANIDFKAPNFSIDLFTKQCSLIYNFVSIQDKIFIYNRSSSNTENYDIESYIEELYKTSITKNISEIALTLSMQLSGETNIKCLKELENLVQNVVDNQGNALTKISKIFFTRKTYFTIRKIDNMYISVTLNNIQSLIELNYFNFWLSRVTYNSLSTKKQITSEKQKSSSSSSEPIRSASKSSDSLSELSSSGGMPRKEINLKQLDYLQKLDSNLFNKKELYNNKTYAQTCQGNRQPLGLPTQKFQKYKDSVDNHLEINNNTYFCPRYWCLESEQPILDKTKTKCEKDEEPIDIYATKQGTFNKPDTPRYVNYYSKDYLKPCCYLRNKTIVLKKESQSALSASNIHIFTTFNAVPENRYGMLPESILELIDNKTSGLNCGEKLKSKKCAFRMGISRKNCDLMDILTKMLKYEKRYDLVKTIYNELDLMKFISLENGEIAREFMKRAFYKNYKKIDKKVLFRNYNINISPSSRKTIDYAFNAFIDYLRNDNVDNPHYLYSLIAIIFGCNIYIWKYKNDTNFHLLNPLYSSYEDIRLLSNSGKAINIFYNNNLNLFEPIVLKSTNSLDYLFNFSSTSYSSLHQLYVPSTINKNILKNISKYTAVYNKSEFEIKKILLNNNLTVNHFVLKNGKILKIDKIIEPILFNRLLDILLVKDIELYDAYYYNFSFTDTNTDCNTCKDIKAKFNFEIIFSYLEPQRFDNSILFYNTITLENETKYNNQLIDIVDETYEKRNLDNKIFKDEISNHKNLDDWYNSYNFNNTFMTDKISYLKDKLAFSNKAIGEYSKMFKQSYKTEIVETTNDHKSIVKDIKLESNFTKGELANLPSKFKSYKLNYVNSLHYNDDSIYEFLTTILKQDKKEEIKELATNTIKKMFGSIGSFNILCYILDYKNIILTELKLPLDTANTNIIYDRFKKLSDVEKEQSITNIIKQCKTSEIDLYALSELSNIGVLVLHFRKYHLLNPDKNKYKRDSVEDLSATCNLFINRNIRKDYGNYPFLMIYAGRDRLYFINNGYYNKALDVSANIKEIIEYKLKTYKDII